MRNISIFICFCLIIFLFFGCSKKDNWKGQIEYVDGVKVIKNFDKGIWEGSEKEKKIVFKGTRSGATRESSPCQGVP